MLPGCRSNGYRQKIYDRTEFSQRKKKHIDVKPIILHVVPNIHNELFITFYEQKVHLVQIPFTFYVLLIDRCKHIYLCIKCNMRPWCFVCKKKDVFYLRELFLVLRITCFAYFFQIIMYSFIFIPFSYLLFQNCLPIFQGNTQLIKK